MENFNPNDICVPNGNYFALPFDTDEGELILISAPWDVTTSYRAGTSKAPDAILDASLQVDLYDYDFGNIYEKGIATHPFDEDMLSESKKNRVHAEKVISRLEIGLNSTDWTIAKSLEHINESCEKMNNTIYETAKSYLEKGKKVALIGGDHSTSYGIIKATAEKYGEIAILHIDAHADLRKAYEGFTYSHASIMYNVINDVKELTQLTQVGIRDFCEDEKNIIDTNDKITTFFDRELHNNLFEGGTWEKNCEKICDSLPKNIYISLDIDGLSPEYCTNTGTPVPGGLSYNELIYLLVFLKKKGKNIIGFDLVEVSQIDENSVDANIGARLLYKLSLLCLEK